MTEEKRAALRPATKADAPALARFVNMAGEGMPYYLWTQLAAKPGAPSRDPWEIGRLRQEKKVEEAEIVVADAGEGAIGGLTGYKIGDTPDPIDDETPNLFRPLIELENLALNSWYVNVLAVAPEARGQGWGALLIEEAMRIAKRDGMRRMSIIVADANHGARRLYERFGFQETARRPIVAEEWRCDSADWVLLIRDDL